MILFLMGVIILLYIMIGSFLYMQSKFRNVIFILCFLVLLTSWRVLTFNHYFISSTNLEYESIEKYRLDDILATSDLHSYDTFEKRENDNGYFYDLKDLYVSTDKENKIISISTKELAFETSSGLKKGDSIENTKLIYGDNYYTYREMGLGKARVYIDRDNKYTLTVWSKDDSTVENIWLTVY